MGWFDRDLLREIKSAVEQLAAGDYTARVPRLNNAHDALGQSINAFSSRVQNELNELSRDKTHLLTVLSNMAEGVVAVDLKGNVLFMNAALGALFGVRPNETIGRPLLEVIRQNQINDLVHHVLAEEKSTSGEVNVISLKDLVFNAHAAPLVKDGRTTGALVVLRDVTQVRHLEQVRRDFVANVSHELRTPLTAIKGFAETLRDGALEDPDHAREFLLSIEKNADDMIALAQDLLDLTSIESGQRAPRPEIVDLAVLARDVAQDLEPIARKQTVKIKNEIAPGATVFADKKHVQQILLNLAENAIKFNDAGGWLRFSSEISEEKVRVSVADNGPGISAQDLPRIFERFYRTDRARSRASGGTGLGLAIVKHLAEANRGSVEVQSSVGKGSEFSVYLPVPLKHA